MSSGILGITDSGDFTVALHTESVGFEATRLAAVIVTRRKVAPSTEEARGWLRRLLARRPAPKPAREDSLVQYDHEEREVRVLDRRWPVPRGELALAVLVDFRAGGGGPPAVATRTFAAPAVPKEPFKADPRASRRKIMKRLREHTDRHRHAEKEALRAALRADPELRAFLEPEIESFLRDPR